MKTILIVDDEKDLRDLLKVRFEGLGFKCLIAESGSEAIKLTKQAHPTVILLDLVMPEMDGYQVSKILKGEDSTKDIPIIAYTAQPPEIVIKKGPEAFDFVDVILKPFDTDVLVQAVEKTIQKPGKEIE